MSRQEQGVRVLMVTTGWPTPGQPQTTHFIKRQVDFLRAAGVTVDVFRFHGHGRLLNYVRAWLKIRTMLFSGRYDLIHAQWGHSAIVALPTRLPMVVTFRGGDLHGRRDSSWARQTRLGRILVWLCRMMARRADAVILVSEHMSALLPPGTPFNVIPSGLDLDHFRPLPRLSARTRLGLSFEDRLILFAGDPASSRKRYDLAQQAVAMLDPELRARLVIAWGVPHAEMPYYMNACDTLVFTSRQEGSPNVVKEALACDLPVVAVPVGDVATRVGPVNGCELCTDDQPHTIAAALDRVLRRGTRCEGRLAVRELDERLTTSRVIAIYRSLLRRPLETAETGLVTDPGQP